MTWVIPWSRRSAKIQSLDEDDESADLINGYICDGAVRSFVMSCPLCGAFYEIKANDRQSRTFDRPKQLFRCRRCRFVARVYIIVDVAQRRPRWHREAAATETAKTAQP